MFCILAKPALGFEILKDVESYFNGYLIENVMNGRDIRYSISIKDQKRFPDWSIDAQVEVAMERWLLAFKEMGLPTPKLIRCPQKDPNIDLLIEIRPLKSGNPAAYQDYRYRNGRPYVAIVMDSEQTNDIRQFLKGSRDFKTRLNELVKFNLNDIYGYEERFGIDNDKMYGTTYIAILHELGHAFGLADTQTDEIILEYTGKKVDASIHPPATMKYPIFFDLQPDDKKGIKGLVKEFRNKAGTSCMRLSIARWFMRSK